MQQRCQRNIILQKVLLLNLKISGDKCGTSVAKQQNDHILINETPHVICHLSWCQHTFCFLSLSWALKKISHKKLFRHLPRKKQFIIFLSLSHEISKFSDFKISPPKIAWKFQKSPANSSPREKFLFTIKCEKFFRSNFERSETSIKLFHPNNLQYRFFSRSAESFIEILHCM